MSEIESILEVYDGLKSQGQACVLATVVHVEGSSYRRAGARMLVAENGQMSGAISGGCLEGDALKKALLALHQGQNKLVTYDTNDEDDAIIGAQLGCNGVIQVLFEPLFPDTENPIDLLKKMAGNSTPAALVTLFNLQKDQQQPGSSLYIDADLVVSGQIENQDLLEAIKADARQVFEQKRSFFGAYRLEQTTINAFIEYHNPPIKLVLVGAGNDAQVLARMAELLGWQVSIADGRPTHANAQRFGAACQIIVAKPEKVLERLQLDARSAVVLMTHNFPYDLAIFKALLDFPQIPYIGILGPKKRYQRMLDALQDEGIALTSAQAARVHAPVGLDLGAENASEIALSVLAEILAVFNGAGAGQLRSRSGPIHDKSHYVFQEKQI